MTFRVPGMGRAAAACACAFALGVAPAHAARRAEPPAPPAFVAEPPNPAQASLPLVRDSVDARRLALARAAVDHARGDFAEVAATLAPLRLESSPPFPDADRAAFLLGHAWLRLGQWERLAALARAVTTWPRQTPFTRWLAFEARLADAGDPAGAGPETIRPYGSGTGAGPGAALAASSLLREGRLDAVLALIPAGSTNDPLLLQLRALALARLGRDDGPELERLAAADPSGPLAADLAGAALVRLATRAAERAADPRPLLARVPAASRYASRARHMSALATLERGDTATCLAELAALLASDPAYAGRRDAALVPAAEAMDRARWDEALARYVDIDADWARQREALRRRLSPDSAASLWRSWEHDRSAAEALVLDGLPAASLTEALALAAADAAADSVVQRFAVEPALGLPGPAAGAAVALSPPPEAWERARASARALAALRGRWVLVSDSLDRERSRLADRRRYFGHLSREMHEESRKLARGTTLLDSLARNMEGTAQRLLALRAAATLHFERRAAWVIARCELQARWLAAMRHFYLDGPDGARQAATPPRLKGPDVVLAQEQELAQSLRFSAGRLLAETPRRFIQAYEQRWGPSLIDRPGVLAPGTREALVWSRAIARGADSLLALVQTSAEETRLAVLAATLSRRAEQAAAADSALRATLAREAVQRSLDRLAAEREGIDYGLAAASYARSVQLSAVDSLAMVTDVRGGRGRGPDTLGTVETAADSAARRDRDDAISRVSIFLADHAGSAARGEMRFRLADLLITGARVDFRARMAAWLRAQAQGRSMTLPVVDHAQALGVYRRMLEEDTDFPHRDAVLFNAGMLLADSGDPEAAGFFSRLIADHPRSPYVQEASLRLGDLSIDSERLADGVASYERAASGGDPSLRAIALYKSGWAHYNADRFEQAAQAFRGVLDLYAGDARIHIQADIEHEAEQYFVYSLAAAGGAEAYERAFPAGAAERPYERRVLRAMGDQLRRYGELASATRVDQLFLRRWPQDPAALEVVGRLSETQRRSERGADERTTRLEWAERFAPGGAWASAQRSDSLRSAGAEFARSAWRVEAFEHHREARTKGSPAEWRSALENYETLLARWPGDSLAATYELHAGEACAELGEYPAALRHYRAAAGASGGTARDSVAARAAWQVVAVTDRWYESTRPSRGAAERKDGTGPARGIGSDSLARAVTAAVDALLERDPRHPKAADLVWRQCQLALAHGWNDQAQVSLARFARTFPGDRRAPLAAGERAEARFRAGDFAAAGEAFEEALAIARRAHADTLARRAEKALPVCAYRAAEAAVAADSSRHDRHAELFDEVARRWPDYEHAPRAQYRAGLAWLAAGNTNRGVRALESMAERWPSNALARDAHLKCARAWEAAGERERAATAYVEFSRKHPQDENADEAWLRAADLFDSTGAGARADALREQYLARWPNDEQAGLEILEKLARRELASLPLDRPLASLLSPPPPQAKKRAAAPPAYLAKYLKRAAQKPALASQPLLAEVRFRLAEEAYARYDALRLTQPLPKSIASKQKLLDSVLVRCRRTVDMGVSEWAHAATFRIGQALVGFATALEKSERPADLTGDDLMAYENVLTEQSMPFHERGESVWSDLLKQSRGGPGDAWTARARESLWGSLADRFLFQPDVEFPVVGAGGPGRARANRSARDDAPPVKPVAEEDRN